MRSIAPLFICILLVANSACNRNTSSSAEQQAAKQLPLASLDSATASTITGTVNFNGSAPKAQKLDMSMDPSCKAQDAFAAPIEVSNGHLVNAFVYVKSGLGDFRWEPPTEPATIDQNGCHYHPHVLGVMIGQPVSILNSDPTTHNVHPMPQVKGNREWNESQGPQAEPIRKTFNAQEVMIPIKCNQHPWMKMYLSVMAHPYFAVTGADGKFEIKNLPPGKYTLAVVHEKLGEQTQDITVGPKENATADFAYSSASGQ